MRLFNGYLIALAVGLMTITSTIATAIDRTLAALMWLVRPGPEMHLSANYYSANLGLQRVGVRQFQRRQGESSRRARYRGAAYRVFGTAALA